MSIFVVDGMRYTHHRADTVCKYVERESESAHHSSDTKVLHQSWDGRRVDCAPNIDGEREEGDG